VFETLLKKLDEERAALGGQVFDVLGEIVFDERPLRELIIQAIRYGDRPDVKERLYIVVDQALDHAHLQALLDQRALTNEVMDRVRVYQIRDEMERAIARRLQPHFIATFFLEAFKRLGGRYYEREPQRYEITFVPALLRNRAGKGDKRAVVQQRYERVTFEKERMTLPGKPLAALLCPGHPLLDLTIDVVLQPQRHLLSQGATLIDPSDMGEEIRLLFYLEHTIQDASVDTTGKRREVSRQLQFVELDASGTIRPAGHAPFLDYQALQEEEQSLMTELRNQPWLKGDLEEQVRSYAIMNLVPRHLDEVRKRREAQIDKTQAAVNERLTNEISYWDNRAVLLKEQEVAGKINAHLNSQLARQRADELQARLERRMNDLEQERYLSPLPPIIVGGVLVVPQGLLDRLKGITKPDQFAHETAAIERIAMQAVIEKEQRLGNEPRDVSREKCGYDIESREPETGKLRFIEVKGRVAEATSIIVTRNEILTALNSPDDFILAVVEVAGPTTTTHYITRPFRREPDFGATSVTYNLSSLLHKGDSSV